MRIDAGKEVTLTASTVPSQGETLTIDEQREAYVLAQMKDFWHLPTPIEQWLEQQRFAGQPDMRGWQALLSFEPFLEAFKGDTAKLLRRNAQTLSISGQLPGVNRKLRLHLSSLDPYKASVYVSETYGFVIVHAHHLNTPSELAVQKKVNGDFEVVSVTPEAVVDVLLTEWKNGHARASDARMILCRSLADEVARIRHAVEFDFDEAVGVSAQGTLIVLADVVVLFEQKSSGSVWAVQYPAMEFSGGRQKLEIDLVCAAYDEIEVDETLADFFSHLVGGLTSAQTLASSFVTTNVAQACIHTKANGHAGKSTVFFSHRSQLKGPLPQGGVNLF